MRQKRIWLLLLISIVLLITALLRYWWVGGGPQIANHVGGLLCTSEIFFIGLVFVFQKKVLRYFNPNENQEIPLPELLRTLFIGLIFMAFGAVAFSIELIKFLKAYFL